MSGVKLDWKDDLVAACLAASVMAVLVATTSNLGYSRDEGFYFYSADAYGRWFDLLLSNPRMALDRKAIDGAWRVNSEHPGLIKSLFALSHLILQKKWHLFSMEGTSYRFPGIALAGAAVALVYRFGAEARGRLAGVFAALALILMPRFFYHAHLACFDVPIITMFLLTVYTYWKSLRHGGWAWPIATGLSFGLALDTKHNSWFLPILCIVHSSVVVLRAKYSGREWKPLLDRALATLGCMAVLGPLVMYTFWPWIWHDTLPRLRAYANFHLHHEYYNMEFFGKTYWKPPMPRLYSPFMTAATVPMVTLSLLVVGLVVCARKEVQRLRQIWARYSKSPALGESDFAALAVPLNSPASRAQTTGTTTSAAKSDISPGSAHPGVAARRRDDDAGVFLLWLCGAGISYGAWVFPSTPIFGGTKHWMTAYPFLALFAGVGFSYLATVLRMELRRMKQAPLRRAARGPIAAAVFFAVTIAAPAAETWSSHPWGLSSYSPLVGGAKGAATLGLNRTFWGYTTGSVVDYLNREVPKNGTVYVHDTSWPAWEMLLKDGRLRKDIRGTGAVHDAMFALYHHEQHMQGQEYQAWVAYGTVQPAHVAGLHGVPVIWIYRRK